MATPEEERRKALTDRLSPKFFDVDSNAIPDMLQRINFSDSDSNGVPDMIQRAFPNNLRPNSALFTGGDTAGNMGSTTTADNAKQKSNNLLRNRQRLASEIKSYVDSGQEISPEDAMRMKDAGSRAGLKSSDLSALYKQYKEDQPLGSSSSLRDSVGKIGESRSLGTLSGDMRREARRLRREGYMKEAGELAGAAAMQRLNEPNIRTQEQRGRMDLQAKQADMAAREAAALKREETDFMRDLYRRRREQLDNPSFL